MKKPTPSQIIVMCHMNLNHPPRIHRLPGGFWVTRSTPIKLSGVPAWSTSIQTIRAMEKQGLLKPVHHHAEEWRDERELTEKGIGWVLSEHLR